MPLSDFSDEQRASLKELTDPEREARLRKVLQDLDQQRKDAQ